MKRYPCGEPERTCADYRAERRYARWERFAWYGIVAVGAWMLYVVLASGAGE